MYVSKEFSEGHSSKIGELSEEAQPNSVHIVLANLCYQMDLEENTSESDDATAQDDAEIFRNAVTHHVRYG